MIQSYRDNKRYPMINLKKTLFCNVAWMKSYSGLSRDDKPFSGAKYVSETNDAYEKYNFLNYEDGYQYGFVETKHPNGTVDLTTSYKKFILSNFGEEFKDSEFADGILVVFFARNPLDMKFYIVGYYKNADVFRIRQFAHNDAVADDIQYNLRCKKEDAVLIDSEKRLPLNLPEDTQLFYRQLFFYPLYSKHADVCKKIVENILKYDETNNVEWLQFAHRFWIVPSNLNFYDLDSALNELADGLWYSQRVNDISAGDYLYIYVAAPISAYRYKCLVTKSNTPLNQIDVNEDKKYYRSSDSAGGASVFMRIKLVGRLHVPLSEILQNVPHVSVAPQSQRRLTGSYLSLLEKRFEESIARPSLADLDDDMPKENVYYGEISSSPNNPITRDGVKYFQRNDKVREIALSNSENKCAIQECKHDLFISKTGKPYLEVHHIIPINAQNDFPNINIDIPENVVCLCPSCHREIHNGQASEEKIIELFNLRKNALSRKGLLLSNNDLLKYYGIIK